MEPQNPTNPSESVAAAPDVSAPAGDENGGENTTFSLEAINKAVGREYKSLEEAEKGLKETYSYVGEAPKLKKDLEDAQAKLAELTQPKKGAADEVAELKEQIANLSKQRELDDWYKANPEYADHRSIISKLGDNPADVVADESNKPLFDALLNPAQPRNTVMDSNSQPNRSDDYEKDLAAAKETGNWAVFINKHKGGSSVSE